MKMIASETCVIIIDFQNDSCGAGLESEEKYRPIIAAVGATKLLLQELRSKGINCIFTKHIEEKGRLPENMQTLYNNKSNLGGGHYVKGQPGSELFGNLSQDGDMIIEKTYWGAFSAESLNSSLKLAKIKNIIVCGTETETCVLSTVTEAFDLGYNIFLPKNCIATKAHKMANHHVPVMEILNNYYGYVIDEAELIASF